METMQINHSCYGKYTVRPMDPSWVMTHDCNVVVQLLMVQNMEQGAPEASDEGNLAKQPAVVVFRPF